MGYLSNSNGSSQ
jgi:hypothetical protein